MGTDIVLYKRLDVSNQIVETQKEKIERQSKIIKGLGKIIENLMKDKEEAEIIKTQNDKYVNAYGNFDLPFLILKEMFKNNQVPVGGIATPPTKFKHPALEYKKNNRDSINFWISLFEQWGIIDNGSSRHYITEMSYKKAKQILREKILNE